MIHIVSVGRHETPSDSEGLEEQSDEPLPDRVEVLRPGHRRRPLGHPQHPEPPRLPAESKLDQNSQISMDWKLFSSLLATLLNDVFFHFNQFYPKVC